MDASFKTTDGAEWHVRFTPHLIGKVRSEFEVDLHDLRGLSKVLDDVFLLGGVLWLICEKQAAQRGIDQERFAESFDGDVVGAAIDAMQEAYVNFTPPSRRTSVRTLLDEAARGGPAEGTENRSGTGQRRPPEGGRQTFEQLWQLVHQLAGACGISPRVAEHMTLRELVWMAEGAWDHTAAVLAMLHNTNVTKDADAKSPAFFHPFKTQNSKKPPPRTQRQIEEDRKLLRLAFPGGRKTT